MAAALGHNRLHALTRGYPPPTTPYCDLANPKRMSWREHPEAAALHDRIVALRHMEGFTDPEELHDAQ